MNQVQKAIYEHVVKPAIAKLAGATTGTVISYNNITNTATVIARSPVSGRTITMHNVPVQIGVGGFHSAGPFPGDTVEIQFKNNNIMNPVIVAFSDYEYELKTRNMRYYHPEQGTFLPDCIGGVL